MVCLLYRINVSDKHTPPVGYQSRKSCLNTLKDKGAKFTVIKLTQFLSKTNKEPAPIAWIKLDLV